MFAISVIYLNLKVKNMLISIYSPKNFTFIKKKKTFCPKNDLLISMWNCDLIMINATKWIASIK